MTMRSLSRRQMLKAAAAGGSVAGSKSAARMRIIQRLYDIIQRALWGGLAIWALIAVWIILQTPHTRAEFQRRLTDEIFEENRFYCTRWGFKEGTHEYNLCEIDLADIRAKAEERLNPTWP